jgi:hypothetical protein
MGDDYLSHMLETTQLARQWAELESQLRAVIDSKL